jgi:regulator of replication initiation timing
VFQVTVKSDQLKTQLQAFAALQQQLVTLTTEKAVLLAQNQQLQRDVKAVEDSFLMTQPAASSSTHRQVQCIYTCYYSICLC